MTERSARRVRRLRFREGHPPLAWGAPDSPRRMLCSICHGKLPEVPLTLWDDKGACLQLCDPCVEKWIRIE
jgi:hypothetical protein